MTPKEFLTAVLLVALIVSWGNAIENKVEVAPPKKGVTPEPPLSSDLPEGYSRLPVFGSIEWVTEELPWVEEGPYAGISGVAMDTHRDKIIVVGGFIPGGDETTDSASRKTSRWSWVFDTVSGDWSRISDAPDRREYGRGLVAEDIFYFFGGGKQYKNQSPPYRPHAECFACDLTGKPVTWQHHSMLTVPRTHMAVGRVDNFLVVSGGNEYDFSEKGYSSKTIRDTTDVFDLTNPDSGWQTRSPIPAAGRGWAATAATEEHLYVFGGLTWNKANETVGIRETWRYNPSQDQWEEKMPPPISISGWTGALFQQRYALIVGGVMREKDKPERLSYWSDLVWMYDVKDDKWWQVNGTLPPGAVFNDSSVAIIGETIYVLGGEGPSGSHYDYFLIGHIKPKLN